MPMFRKKPVVIEAMQFLGITLENVVSDYAETFDDWIAQNQGDKKCRYIGSKEMTIPTLEGKMTASVGDWIIKGVHGELYPCKPDIFEKTYEPA